MFKLLSNNYWFSWTDIDEQGKGIVVKKVFVRHKQRINIIISQ